MLKLKLVKGKTDYGSDSATNGTLPDGCVNHGKKSTQRISRSLDGKRIDSGISIFLF